jgi:hypothetical protein
MAQLDKDKAEEAKTASTGFAPLPDGVYHFALKDVDPSRSGKKGPYWSWEFECIEEGTVEIVDEKSKEGTREIKLKGRRMWNNTSLASMWSFKQTFDAFGKPTDTDTDEILGEPCRLVLSTRTIAEGTRKGELANQVDRVLPADEESDVVKNFRKQKSDEKEMADIF